MGKYLKKFDTTAEYTAFIASDYVKPNVSYIVEGNEVHYMPLVIETRLVATFNVTNASNPTPIMYSSAITNNYFTEVEIDGAVVDTIQSAYTLSVGEHTVKYTLADPTSIGNNAFYECSSITSINIPNSVTSIGEAAFTACGSLTSVTIPSSVTSISLGAFSHCNSLSNITIPNSVTSIGSQAFRNCSGLTSIEIPNSVTTIVDGAFYGCSGLTSVTIGSGVTSIGGSAFQSCSNLSTITSHIIAAPSVYSGTFGYIKTNGTLYVPIGSSGYETWMNTQGNLGSYNWTMVEQ